MDGVLSDFEDAFCREFGYDNRHEVDLVKRYPNKELGIHQFLNDPVVYENLEPIVLGMDITNWLHGRGYDITVVTARPNYMLPMCVRWLKRFQIPYFSLICDRPKTGRISLIKPLVAVDDFISVRESLSRSNIPTIIVAQPWNSALEGNSQRISTLEQFIEEFDKIRNE